MNMGKNTVKLARENTQSQWMKIFLSFIPAPVGTVLMTLVQEIEACESADELEKKFDFLKAEVKKLVSDSQFSVPRIPIEVQVNFASLIIFDFLEEISDDETDEVKNEIQERFDNANLCTKSTVDSRSVIIELPEPTERDCIIEDYVEAVIECLDEFDIKVKNYAFV